MIRKTPAWIALLLLVTCGGFVQIESKACEESPGKPAISVSGAQAGSDPNYYVVEIPAQGTTTVTITGSGQTPCPTDAEKCTCQYNSDKATQDTDGDSKFTFVKPLGTQDANDGPNVKIDITSSTAPNEYKFKVSKIEQMYKPCSNGWTGGVTSKSNNQSSDEVTVCVVKFELDDIDITGGGTSNAQQLPGGEWKIQPPDVSVIGTAKFQPSSAERNLVGKVRIRMIQNVSTVHRMFLRSTPPNGYHYVSGGSYVYDNMAVSTIGTTVALGGIGGTFYDDAPWVIADPFSSKEIEMSDVFKVYLQYSFDSGPWRTVGVRYWSASGSASGPVSGKWAGGAWAGPNGSAIHSTDEPVWYPNVTSLTPQSF